MKKVSIIIPVYNQSSFLRESAESALLQTYNNIEIIIINDGSTDETANIAKNIEKNNPGKIKFFNFSNNRGVIFARNFGIENASGDYILPLDGDDIIEPTYVEKAVNILEKNPNVGIVYPKARLFGYENKVWKLPEAKTENIIFSNCIFACALFRKDDFLKAGKYSEDFNNGYEDWDLWLSFFELGLEPYRINEILFNYRQYKKGGRNSFAIANATNLQKKILKRHINLYLQNDAFIKAIFTPGFEKFPKKIKKYRKIYQILLPVCIVELSIILMLLAGYIVK